MKPRLALLLTFAALLACAQTHLHSQNPGASSSGTVAKLTQIKAENDKTIARQKATLEQLKSIAEEVKQIKSFSKRG